jgi:ATP-dependent Clp protease ATP-binding subunit ClpA
MFERFTQQARQVVVFAQEDARELRHSHIGSEALLLGLLREQDGVARRALESLGVSLETARLAVARHVAFGEERVEGSIPFTPRAERILYQASDEAAALNDESVGTEHILLALATIEEGVGMNILRDFDLDATSIRGAVDQRLVGSTPANPPRRERARTRWRRPPGAEAGPSVDPFHGLDVRPDEEVAGVLIGAAARALEDGRTETTIGDLLITLSRVKRLRPFLPELAGGETQIRAALQRLGRDEPAESANGA